MKIDLLSAIFVFIRKFRPIHLHWANIDLAASAMICQVAFNRLPTGKTSHNLTVNIVLGLAVFVISSMNRLLDNRKPAKTEMKRFLPNQKNRITFLEVVAGGLVIGIFMAFYMPASIWKIAAGMVISSGVCVWLISLLPERSPLHALRAPVSSVIFTTGILAFTIFSNQEIEKEIKYLAILFSLTVFQNFLLSSYYQSVEYPNVSNLSGLLKATLSKRILHIITFLIIAGGIFICLHTDFRYTQRLTVILTLMGVLQSFMLQNTGFMQKNKYKGMLVTMVLLIPLLIL
ncbi:hypothetical protein ACFP1I_21780 [Dyadobacter subterraneus]|uniref:Uncharacterized protein n=1 Tax=Dyadobacter subterraneus TaxID=2773304 RepID=A0ABR9W566_9BACT|nr:hypothetical protein [Dyadobacter subterraneus]MBE9460603.1 hypothetical protein [Dyadobacter subterraneus]